ncbi:MAG: 16S rRNA (uracil(1498)-N(3))-methyltransferase [Bacteroidetes bacterium]|nr:16S rRNA (uracil(1498)-N(3))-methyltransferase [Bacteroidota bacterium]
MQLFYTPDIDIASSAWYLSEEESKHCVRVLRLQNADHIELIDGKGNFYRAEIVDAHPKRTLLKILLVEQDPNKRNHYLHIAVAPTKNIERLEWFLEKATEIGIDEISLIICQRSERKDVKTDRLNKIITAAIKQSIKAWRPVLNEPVPFNKLIASEFIGQKFIAHCEPGDKSSLKDEVRLSGQYMVLIGPEGDFAPNEIEDAQKSGFKAITLGESRLRTETAALEACFEINFLNRV